MGNAGREQIGHQMCRARPDPEAVPGNAACDEEAGNRRHDRDHRDRVEHHVDQPRLFSINLSSALS
jgi:hypothetical protein